MSGMVAPDLHVQWRKRNAAALIFLLLSRHVSAGPGVLLRRSRSPSEASFGYSDQESAHSYAPSFGDTIGPVQEVDARADAAVSMFSSIAERLLGSRSYDGSEVLRGMPTVERVGYVGTDGSYIGDASELSYGFASSSSFADGPQRSPYFLRRGGAGAGEGESFGLTAPNSERLRLLMGAATLPYQVRSASRPSDQDDESRPSFHVPYGRQSKMRRNSDLGMSLIDNNEVDERRIAFMTAMSAAREAQVPSTVTYVTTASPALTTAAVAITTPAVAITTPAVAMTTPAVAMTTPAFAMTTTGAPLGFATTGMAAFTTTPSMLFTTTGPASSKKKKKKKKKKKDDEDEDEDDEEDEDTKKKKKGDEEGSETPKRACKAKANETNATNASGNETGTNSTESNLTVDGEEDCEESNLTVDSNGAPVKVGADANGEGASSSTDSGGGGEEESGEGWIMFFAMRPYTWPVLGGIGSGCTMAVTYAPMLRRMMGR